MKLDRILGILTVLLQSERVTASALAKKFEVRRAVRSTGSMARLANFQLKVGVNVQKQIEAMHYLSL